jgi:hypothetical protein
VVWLIEASTGKRTTLFESLTRTAGHVSVGPDDTVSIYHFGGGLPAETEEIELRFDGTQAYRGPVRPPPTECRNDGDAAVVEGRPYDGARCGLISPDRVWMTYEIDAGMVELQPGFSVPSWDQWVVNLATGGKRELQAGLRHCGGCDGRFGPSWSVSGRFLTFAELAQPSRVFLSDLDLGNTRELAVGSSDISSEPDWSPVADLLVYRRNGVTVLEDLPRGSVTELPELPWPVRFDASGGYLYSPAWGEVKDGGGSTTVYDVRAGRVVATLAGRARYQSLWLREGQLAASGDSFVAVLEGAPDCGVAVYSGTRRLTCIVGGSGAVLSPDGRYAAVGRTQNTVPTNARKEYDVLLVDMATGAVRVVATGALSEPGSPQLPPQFIWNARGTHVIVRWPFAGGGL